MQWLIYFQPFPGEPLPIVAGCVSLLAAPPEGACHGALQGLACSQLGQTADEALRSPI